MDDSPDAHHESTPRIKMENWLRVSTTAVLDCFDCFLGFSGKNELCPRTGLAARNHRTRQPGGTNSLPGNHPPTLPALPFLRQYDAPQTLPRYRSSYGERRSPQLECADKSVSAAIHPTSKRHSPPPTLYFDSQKGVTGLLRTAPRSRQ